MSDYPANEVLQNLGRNINENVPATKAMRPAVYGHIWGCFDSEFCRKHKNHFTRILAADCLWMPQEHENLVRSIEFFLSESSDARVFVVAGFHTGRAKVVPFFDVAEEAGFSIEMYEVDVDGNRREWERERDGGKENVTERKKWLVVADMRRALSIP